MNGKSCYVRSPSLRRPRSIARFADYYIQHFAFSSLPPAFVYISLLLTFATVWRIFFLFNQFQLVLSFYFEFLRCLPFLLFIFFLPFLPFLPFLSSFSRPLTPSASCSISWVASRFSDCTAYLQCMNIANSNDVCLICGLATLCK